MSSPHGPINQTASPRTNRATGCRFSLWALLLILTGISEFFALAIRYPNSVAFFVFMSAVLIVPLSVMSMVVMGLQRAQVIAFDVSTSQDAETPASPIGLLPRVARFLGLLQPIHPAGWKTALAVALITMGATVFAWGAIRDTAVTLASVRIYGIGGLSQFLPQLKSDLTSVVHLKRMIIWELLSVTRWWLLFGAITSFWLLFTASMAPSLRRESALQIVCRLFFFAPWIAFLELAFLVGVLLVERAVVPEPSTGFVLDIFSWDLWHWDCWMNRFWLMRGAVPTLAAGLAFFRGALAWHWTPAIAGAVCLIPVALLLSIAATVFYFDLITRGLIT